MSNLVKKVQGSVFAKLLFVMIVAGILAIISTLGIIRLFAEQFISPFRKNAAHYTNYIIQEIGVPPDTVKARKMARYFSFQIRFKSPDFRWTTNDNIMSFKDFDKITSGQNEKFRTEWDEAIWYTAVIQDSCQYLFAFDFKKNRCAKKEKAGLLIILLTLVFTIAYLLIRRTLIPIRWIMKGVEQVGKGNLKYQVQVQNWRRDELGKLAELFNSMTRRISEMIRLKEQLLIDVSHELRSPLARIKIATEFISDDETKESIEEDLADVEKMITEILETERLNSNFGKLYLETTNVADIIKQVSQYFKDKSPGIKLVSMPQNVFFKIDIDRIKIVLKNIIDNSIKYSTPESQPVEISINEENKFVTVTIKDYGTGIPENELSYIFEPFYRIDKSRSKETGGYGLGMSLCKKIMEAHGGSIEINSELNIGTTVILRFSR